MEINALVRKLRVHNKERLGLGVHHRPNREAHVELRSRDHVVGVFGEVGPGKSCHSLVNFAVPLRVENVSDIAQIALFN